MLRSGSKASMDALSEGMSWSYMLPRSIVSIMASAPAFAVELRGKCSGEAGRRSGLRWYHRDRAALRAHGKSLVTRESSEPSQQWVPDAGGKSMS